MPAYSFKAYDTGGKAQRGVIEAASPAGARRALRERSLIPTEVTPAASATDPGRSSASSFLADLMRPRVGARALAALTRQLSTMIGSGIRIEEALRILGIQNASRPEGPVLNGVRSAVLEGRSFASALGEHPRVFPVFYRASVAAGEQSGRLEEVLSHLTDFVERRERSQKKVQLALIYPSLLALVSVLIIGLMLVFVVPDITRVFVSRGVQLPLLTRMLIGLSAGIQNYGWIAGLLAVVGAVVAQRWLAIEANSIRVARFIARRPPTSRFSLQLNAARFAGSLATLISSGVPLVDAVNSAAAVTPNAWLRERARLVGARVREGASLQRAMTEADCFPPMLIAVVASGEASGRLGDALGRAAHDLDADTEALSATLVALVEPAILLFMGGVVLLLVLAILMPIVNLNNLAGM
ncbi:type II secretion system F family protein [Brevundimonas sp.]|uniref:type II secretion system F family protein n=1 Tax=Brevundimonas sp. TaxID=1871086 RepID=UPI001A285D31|nr:type II secretion system F family protein [Brevundimonas sp.]MBJ7484971.1 type II secretion system F family protein [Brevundimonas sp.]